MALGAVVARILTQYSDKGSKAASKDIAKLGKSFDAFAKKSSRAFGIAAAASAVALAKIAKDSIMAASDLSQQFGALDAVFGNNADQLKDFSKSMVDYGLSTADAARFAALLGTQLKGLGIEEQDAINRTKELQILAADLAATYGGTTADAVAALSSTFKGEYNPIERYGVAIRKSDITARVAAKGLGQLKGDLLKAAEAQTAFEIITEKTTAAQGQSRREYNTLAAQLQRVDATFENIKATLGTALLPIMEQFAELLITRILPQIEQFVNVNKDQLAASFAVAAEFAVKFLEVAVAFGDWVANNMTTVKNLAKVIAGMFVVSKVASFITAIQGLIVLMTALAATSTAAAIATALATGGANLAIGGAAIAASTYLLIAKNTGGSSGAGTLPEYKSTTNGYLGSMPVGSAIAKSNPVLAGPASDLQKILDDLGKTITTTTKATKALLTQKQKELNLRLKELGITTTEQQKEIDQMAIIKNLKRQDRLSGSPTIALGGIGSNAYNKGPVVNIYNQGSVVTEQEVSKAVTDGQETIARRNGGLFNGRPTRAIL